MKNKLTTITFGGPITTPTLDRFAKGGLRYNHFHTTALCSPSRTAATPSPFGTRQPSR